MKFVSILSFIMLFTCCRIIAQVHPDLPSLQALYNSTNGANWNDNTGWAEGVNDMTSDPCNGWEGVSCTNDRVTSLNLSNNNLEGTLPNDISNLEKLQGLYLTNNDIEGSIPDNIGNLKSLRQLRLQNNKLTGPIPASLGDLDSIFIIYFHDNQLSGCYDENLLNLCDVGEFRLPNNENLPWAGDFTKFCEGDGSLESQEGSYCGLGGDGIIDDCGCVASNEFCYTPDYLLCQDWLQAEIAALECYDLGFGNRQNFNIGVSKYQEESVVVFLLAAELVSKVLSTRNVYTCDGELLESCSYSLGTNCPDSITIYSQLFVPPTIFYRCMEDNIPDCSMIEAHPDYNALSSLFDTTNGLDWTNQDGWRSGMQNPYSNPCDWAGVTCTDGRVTELILTNNNLDGIIPPEIGQLEQLVVLDMSSNNLTGTIPSAIGENKDLMRIKLQNNQFEGSIPEGFGQLVSLIELNVENNNLSGCFPEDLMNLCNAEVSFADNFKMPWKGDFSEFCNSEGSLQSQWGTVCDDGDDSNGTQDVIVEGCTCEPEIVSISEIEDDSFLIYPNPSTGLFNLSMVFDQIEVVHASGKIVKTFFNTEVFDLFDQEDGLYFIKAVEDKDEYFSKVVLTRF